MKFLREKKERQRKTSW